MPVKKYLYVETGEKMEAGRLDLKNQVPYAASYLAISSNECLCQVSMEETKIEDLDETMGSKGFSRHGEITGADVKSAAPFADRPTFSEVPKGFMFWATDQDNLYIAGLAGWVQMAKV